MNTPEPYPQGEEVPTITTSEGSPAGSTTSNESIVQTSADSDSAEEEHEAEVAARIAELRTLSRRTDAESLEVLLSEVRSSDEKIREAALFLISQSGNRAAIPGLTQAAEQTEHPNEKRALLEAIEFLETPTLTEVLSHTNH